MTQNGMHDIQPILLHVINHNNDTVTNYFYNTEYLDVIVLFLCDTGCLNL